MPFQRYNSRNGVVLLITITMISVFATLVLSIMQLFYVYTKTQRSIVEQRAIQHELEQVAKRVISMPNDNSRLHCISYGSDPNDVIQHLHEQEGCVLTDKKGASYHYWLDDAGDFPCLQIAQHEKTYSSHHWLISVTSRGGTLQLRLAVLGSNQHCQAFQARRIPAGIISWRYLSG